MMKVIQAAAVRVQKPLLSSKAFRYFNQRNWNFILDTTNYCRQRRMRKGSFCSSWKAMSKPASQLGILVTSTPRSEDGFVDYGYVLYGIIMQSSCNHHALKAAPPPRPTWIASRLCIYNAHIHSKRIFRITCWEARKSKSSAWTQSIA